MKKKSYLQYQLEQKSEEELLEISEQIDDRLFGIQDTKEKPDVVFAGELVPEAKELVDNWGKHIGLSTGIKGVDYNMRGLAPGEMTVIAGETSHGKTALGVNIAANVANTGTPVLFVTLEITQAALTARVMKLLGKDDLSKLPLMMQRNDELDWRDIDKLIEVAKDNGAQLIVIDHLHFFTREVERLSEDLGRITKQFKKNAIRHKIPIILISHVRKKESIKSPELSNDALRGSSYIAQDADIVMFVHKISQDRIIVKTTKNRRGYDFENDTVELEFIDGALIKDINKGYIDPFEEMK